MRLLGTLLYGRRGLVTLTLGVSVLSVAASLWWNARLSNLIDMISRGSSLAWPALRPAVAAILAGAAISYGLGLCSGWTCETLAHDLRMWYAGRLTACPLAEIENINTGEYLSGLQNEIGDISGYLREQLFSLTDDLIRFAATFAWLLWLNPKLALLANLPLVFLLGYTVFTSKVIGEAAWRTQQANAKMNGFTDTLTAVFPLLRLYDATDFLRRQYEKALDEWETAGVTEEHRRARLMSLAAPLSSLPLVLLFILGGTQVIRGDIGLGMLYVFINLSGNVSGVMMNMPGRVAAFRRFSANLRRLGQQAPGSGAVNFTQSGETAK